MGKQISKDALTGVWSATPTPLTQKMTVDTQSVKRMVDHHLRLGIRGLFLAGTCGEGAWMPERQKRLLVATVAKYAKGKMLVSVQVTDNSAARILDNMRTVREDGADIAVIAPPLFLLNATPRTLLNLYRQAIRESPLPVGIYDRGTFGSVVVPDEVLAQIYLEPKVIIVKDSSTNPIRRDIALAVRRKRPDLRLFDGDEFHCVDYLKAGYDGLLVGGGIFIGHLAGMIIKAVEDDDLPRAEKLQQRMNRIMYAVYGGKKITCWLSGLKRLMVEVGVFRTWNNYLDYPLTASCLRDIQKVLVKDRDVLLP
jgi:dihydrodipicolinate synthase/N-acetylneuraminate lyase